MKIATPNLATIQQLHNSGDLDNAKTAYLNFLRKYPKNSEALHGLGILCAQQNHFPEAIEYLKKAIHYQPNDLAIRLHLANLFKYQQQFDEAIEQLEQIVKRNPTYPPALNNLGTIYFAQQNFPAAIDAYSRAIAAQPSYTDAFYNLGLALSKQDEISSAIENFQKVLTLSPDNIPAKFQIACLLMRQEKIDEAIAVFLDIEKTHPFHFETQTNLATCYLKKGLLNNAIDHYKKALELNVDDSQILFNLGVIYMQQNNLDLTIQYYQRALQIDPNNFDIHNNLGFAFLTKRHTAFALQHYKEALRIQPNNIPISHTINILSQQKNITTSPPDYVKALFDSYAGHYEAHLLQTLKYTVPELLLQAFLATTQPEPASFDILDLGCGTGLCAAAFKSYANKMVGVDISPKMLEIAAQKALYDQLICQDVEPYLTENTALYHLIVAGDVLVYSGDLTEILYGISKVLPKNGLFIFNVEISEDENYKISQSGRFSHQKTYIEMLAKQNQLQIVFHKIAVTRLQNNEPVYGYLFVLEKIGW